MQPPPGIVRWNSLEEDLESELHLPWWVSSGECSKAAACCCCIEVGVVGAVQDVEHVPLESGIHAPFGEDGLCGGCINRLASRALHRIDTRSAEAAGRWGGECSFVDEVISSAAALDQIGS